MLRKYLAGATGNKASVTNKLIEFGRKFYYYCIVVCHFSTARGPGSATSQQDNACGCPLEKYYRLNFFPHSHAGAWERGAKLVRHLSKKSVEKSRLKSCFDRCLL